MEDNGPSTSGTRTSGYRNWTALSLQKKARELGVSYKGLSKEQLIEALEEACQQDGTEECFTQQGEERQELEVNTHKSQWVVWYEEEMALLGDEATIEDKREAIRTAKERQRMVEAARISGQTVTTAPTMRELPRVSRKDFKPFNEAAGDIEGFFLDFEHQCRLMEVPERERVRHLVGLLQGGAAEAYRAMDPRWNCDYGTIKETILEHYAVTPDTYRAQFRSLACEGEVSFKMYAHRLKQVCHRWLEGEGALTWETFLQVILKEQFYAKCPAEIREWVRERKPTTVEQAAALADEVLTIKPQWKKLLVCEKKPTSSPALAASNVHHSTRLLTHGEPRINVPPITPTASFGIQRGGKIMERRCYGCGQLGHLRATCPGVRRQNSYKSPLPVHYLQTPSTGGALDSPPNDLPSDSDIVAPLPGVYGVRATATCSPDLQHKHLQEVVVDGQRVVGFRDTGAFLTIADPRVIQPGAIQTGPGIAIELAGGTQRYIPRASVTLDYGFGAKQCMIGVMSGLPADVLLGNDVGNLQCHFVGAVTRSQAKRATDVDVFTPSMEVLTPEQPSQPVSDSSCEDHMSAIWDKVQFRQEVETDPTLASFRARAEVGQIGEYGEKIIKENGLLYRVTNATSPDKPWTYTKQLIVPQKYRVSLLHLAHDIPTAGHQGKTRTERRLTQTFYWPGISQAVAHFCRTCDICQRRGRPGDHPKAPLQPLPIIEEPFQRVAVDIIGPLAKPSKSGKRYILTIVDYATRYPEAVALSSISAAKVAEALVTIFTRVGFPSEILSDQGPQFMSELVQCLWRTCGVRAIRTTPYHPQTNGLCERFNGTLKNMLKAFTEIDSDWEKYLPHLLFAYREVPQESTGFSPFELIYGRKVRGPLTLLKEYLEGQVEDTGTPVVPYVLKLRETLAQLARFAQDHVRLAQTRQKTWYDRKARYREFAEGQQVLMVVPHPQNKLQTTWEGPFRVVRKLNDTNYLLALDDKGLRQKTVHVNMIKEYHDRTLPMIASCQLASEESSEEDPLPDLVEATRVPSTVEQVPLRDHLDPLQQNQMLEVLHQRQAAFSSQPGRTTVTRHHVDTQGIRPIQQAPYRVPESVRNTMQKELGEMLQLGVIQASHSPWASPVVLVPKKDGSTRFCVDYRRLNDHTISDAYPMPRIDELLDRLAGAQYVTTLDLSKGYWQIPLTDEGRERSAFITPFGLFEFLYMPFGMKNAPATFQRMVDQILRGCGDFACAYLDDIAIFSHTWEDHLGQVAAVLDRLYAAGLTIRPDKCQIGMGEVQYLGHRVGGGKLRPEPAKIQAIRDWPVPQTKKQVMAFLGTASYYRKFVSHFSSVAKPLTDLTKKNMPRLVIWTRECDQAFNRLKDALVCDPVLAAPDYKRRFIVQTDASSYGLGAVLSQVNAAGEEHPIAYLSRKLLDREVAYATVEKECLAVVWALKKLKPYLYGREFTVVTDHNPLTWLNRVSGDNGRLLRWSLALQPYNFTIQYRRGSQHHNADGLSRQEEP